MPDKNKRKSRETQNHQKEIRRRKVEERERKVRMKDEKEIGESNPMKEYFKNTFRKMAEDRENCQLFTIKGTEKHVNRIEKGRKQQEQSEKVEAHKREEMSKIKGGDHSIKRGEHQEIGEDIHERNREIENELKKRSSDSERGQNSQLERDSNSKIVHRKTIMIESEMQPGGLGGASCPQGRGTPHDLWKWGTQGGGGSLDTPPPSPPVQD